MYTGTKTIFDLAGRDVSNLSSVELREMCGDHFLFLQALKTADEVETMARTLYESIGLTNVRYVESLLFQTVMQTLIYKDMLQYADGQWVPKRPDQLPVLDNDLR